jgi:N-acetylglucosamine-6-phosphate deacetylase
MRKDDHVSDSPRPSASLFAVRGTVVAPTGVVDDGVVVVDGELIAWVGPAADVPVRWADAVRASEPAAGLVLPGLVDLHNHGGGGGSFPDATTATEAATAIAEHRRHGTTTLVASLVTAPRDELLARTALLAGLVAAGELGGIHLEGPFLSHARCGAQNPGDMLAGDPGLVRDIAAAARGHLVTMTIAPEVPGVVAQAGDDDVLAALVSAGAVPSIGHTDASAEQVDAAVARGFDLLATDGAARSGRLTATHLFNGMRPLHHRDPGPIAACLAAAARGELVVELVADGTHLADGTVRSVFDLVGADAIALVTDAMAAAGMPDGEYQLGPKAVTVAGGVARLSGPDGAIAGGVAHLLDVVRQVVAAGIPLVDAVRAASTTPAAVLGRHDIGALVAGRRADVLVTDDDLRPVAVFRGGAPIA